MERRNPCNVYKKFYVEAHQHCLTNKCLLKSVVEINRREISLHYDQHSERLIIYSALDNLLKGASDRLCSVFNLMHGFEETLGLEKFAVFRNDLVSSISPPAYNRHKLIVAASSQNLRNTITNQ
ncbi:MAG: hypothetical protein H7A33_01290 [Deltaproteobacteria bacterium]|nr:hypothetical protein [Deltaproteobacteria bacterium]